MGKGYAGVILAAGKSERFGSAKILADWHGEPLLRHVTKKVCSCGLSPIVVVLGSVTEDAKQCVSDLPVTIVINELYQSGIGTSFSKGVQTLEKPVAGAFLFLCDQPFFSNEMVEEMKRTSEFGDVIIPTVNGEPGHPVLWNNCAFPRIKSMCIGETGRSLQKEFQCFNLAWKSDEILMDIDTVDDYHRLMNKMDLG